METRRVWRMWWSGLFSMAALGHLARAFGHVPVMIGAVRIPVWVSWVVVPLCWKATSQVRLWPPTDRVAPVVPTALAAVPAAHPESLRLSPTKIDGLGQGACTRTLLPCPAPSCAGQGLFLRFPIFEIRRARIYNGKFGYQAQTSL